MKPMVIANPAAGGGSAARAIPRIQTLLTRADIDFDLVRTERRGHGIELARQAVVSGRSVVVAAGGDGTVNEVINGLMEAARQGGGKAALGVLCIGRGNDFAAGVDVPADLEQACTVLAADQRRLIDVGRVSGGLYPEGRFFGNCVGVGFDAVTTIEVAKLPRMGGFAGFFLAVLKTIFLYYRGPVVRITVGAETMTLPSLMVSIMNGRRLGGGFQMAPQAEPDDGLFDLCIARQVSRRRILSMIPHFLRGTQATQQPITTCQGDRISIAAVEGVLPAQTDGEILCTDGTWLEIELLPRQIEVICRRGGMAG